MNKSLWVLVTAIALVAALGERLPTARGAEQPSLDALLTNVAAYKLGDSRRPLEQVQDLVVQCQLDQQKRSALAAKLAGLLSGDATFEAKDFACRQLYIIGTSKEVPAVARLLGNEALSHMARYVLEAMAEPEADAALRQALPSLKGKLLVGVINSLGNRHDAASTGALVGLMDSADAEVATAAIAALGKIGGGEAMQALAGKRTAASPERQAVIVDAQLTIADELLRQGKKGEAAAIFQELYVPGQAQRVRIAALRGIVVAQPERAATLLLDVLKGEDAGMQAIAAGFARQVPGETATRAFVDALSGLPASAQSLLIDALAARGDNVARPAVVVAARGENAVVRASALRALAALGDASDVPMLAEAAAKEDGQIARETLSRLRGGDVDAAMSKAMASAAPPVKIELIRALTARRATAAMPAMAAAAANDSSEPVRIAALESLGALGRDSECAPLLSRVVKSESDAERDAAKNALTAVMARSADRDRCVEQVASAMAQAPVAAQPALVGVLSRAGGDKALGAVRGLSGHANEQVREAAMRALTEWPDAAAINDLFGLARDGGAVYKVLAVRGLVRLVGLPSDRPAAETIKLYRQTLELCGRTEEKRLVLAGLGNTRDAAALEIAVPALGDAALRAEAAAATVKIAQAVAQDNPAAARAALQKVAAADVDDSLKKQARDLLAKMK